MVSHQGERSAAREFIGRDDLHWVPMNAEVELSERAIEPDLQRLLVGLVRGHRNIHDDSACARLLLESVGHNTTGARPAADNTQRPSVRRMGGMATGNGSVLVLHKGDTAQVHISPLAGACHRRELRRAVNSGSARRLRLWFSS